MDLDWVRDFLALAEHRTFSRAAEARNVTQPAFSRRIRALEEWVGTPLFLRDGEVHVDPEADFDDGSLVLRAGAVAAHSVMPIDRDSLDLLAERAPVLDSQWPEAARLALVDLLGTGHAAIAVLESLDQRGLLEKVLPEWAPVRSKPQRNALHRFTVDRHLCEAAANAANVNQAR